MERQAEAKPASASVLILFKSNVVTMVDYSHFTLFHCVVWFVHYLPKTNIIIGLSEGMTENTLSIILNGKGMRN